MSSQFVLIPTMDKNTLSNRQINLRHSIPASTLLISRAAQLKNAQSFGSQTSTFYNPDNDDKNHLNFDKINHIYLITEPMSGNGRVKNLPTFMRKHYYPDKGKIRSCILTPKSLNSWTIQNLSNKDCVTVALKNNQTNKQLILCSFYSDITNNMIDPIIYQSYQLLQNS